MGCLGSFNSTVPLTFAEDGIVVSLEDPVSVLFLSFSFGSSARGGEGARVFFGSGMVSEAGLAVGADEGLGVRSGARGGARGSGSSPRVETG